MRLSTFPFPAGLSFLSFPPPGWEHLSVPNMLTPQALGPVHMLIPALVRLPSLATDIPSSETPSPTPGKLGWILHVSCVHGVPSRHCFLSGHPLSMRESMGKMPSPRCTDLRGLKQHRAQTEMGAEPHQSQVKMTNGAAPNSWWPCARL